MPSTPDESSGQPDWLQQWPDNVEDTAVLTALDRKRIVANLTGKPAVRILSSEHPHQLRDGGDVVQLTAIVDKKESTPGAMIRKVDGRIVKLADISAEYVDTVLKEMEQQAGQ